MGSVGPRRRLRPLEAEVKHLREAEGTGTAELEQNAKEGSLAGTLRKRTERERRTQVSQGPTTPMEGGEGSPTQQQTCWAAGQSQGEASPGFRVTLDAELVPRSVPRWAERGRFSHPRVNRSLDAGCPGTGVMPLGKVSFLQLKGLETPTGS